MRAKLNSGHLKRAAKAAVALNSFAKEKKEDAGAKDVYPCLLTATDKGKLVVESAIFGLYLRYEVEAEVQRPGKFSIGAAPLKNLPENETLELSRVKGSKGDKAALGGLRLRLANGDYVISEHAQAEEMVLSGKFYDRKQIKKNLARIPFSTLREAVKSVTFKPGSSNETLRLQFVLSKGSLDISGTDSFSLARCQIRDKRIKVEKPLQVIVKTGLLGLISDELVGDDDEEATLGVLVDQDKQPIALFLGTSRVELWHPALSGVEVRNYDDLVSAYYKSNPPKCKFYALAKDLQSAINTVTALWAGEAANHVEFVANPGAVSVQAETSGQRSTALVLTEKKITAKKEVGFKAPLHYLKAMLGLVPSTLLLETTVCGDAVLHLKAEIEEGRSAEFVMSQEGQSDEEG